MKKIMLFLLLNVICLYASAQTTALIKNLKDAFGATYTYVGEVKGGMPDGLGMALYTSESRASYYAGYFVKGAYNGKGCIMFKEGNFLSGDWSNGKLNGHGAFLNGSGDLYVGDFVNGKKQGKGTYFYKDNGFITGQYFNDELHGRCIFVPKTGLTIADNIYQKGKKHGSGYHYEVETQKLFEGEWKDGTYLNAGEASYLSFLKRGSFVGYKTLDGIFVGSVNKANKNALHDTTFHYDLKNKFREFGKFENGFLTTGLTIIDDTTRFIGTLNNKGAQGPGSFLEVNQFFKEGIFVNDELDGPNNFLIDITYKTMYYGDMVAGRNTGKAFIVDKYKTLYSGDFVEGKFTGNGWRLKEDGSFMKGKWKDGKPETIFP